MTFRSLFKNYLDLIFSILLTILYMLLVFVLPLSVNIVRIVLGLYLVLFLPGYSLVSTLFPGKDDLDGIERVALSFGLCIAIVPLLGLALFYSPLGISPASILVVLSIFSISLSLIASIRRLKLPAEERLEFSIRHLFKTKEFLGETRWDKILSIILVTSIIALSLTVIYVFVTPRTSEKFTEFYLLGPNETAFEYPTDLKVGEEGKVIIGIVNHEYENVIYRLEVNFNGSLIHEEPIFLIENEKWNSTFTFKAKSKGENQKLEFLLYMDQRGEAYRTLHIWINVT